MQGVERLRPAPQRGEDPELEQREQDRRVEESLCDLECLGLCRSVSSDAAFTRDASALGGVKSSCLRLCDTPG